ncbi:MAG: MBL fold metallo-hydrolase [Desulfobacterales bacterium]|nr:MBL fold metallo-hydrolase [Desulfobacterales bacterium]MBS3755198.1 MBL fold metallo-hydrolase [Desulfobacterales bacterium]
MKITILYDNDALDTRLASDWGFAALIEAAGRRILFDTGAKGQILMENMSLLGISPESIDEIFISHDHWDHTGGLLKILEQKPVRVYVPDTISKVVPARETVSLSRPAEIHDQIYSTGTLKNIEQAMCIRQDGKVAVIAGCSHPGVATILSAASEIGPTSALIGGLHGFSDFPAISSLDLVCATHCTRHKNEIRSRFPETAIAGGAGKIIEI